MALNIVKFCVGIDSVEDLQSSIDFTLEQIRAAGDPERIVHTTRMTPSRKEEILDGGSLYWVIKGMIQVRQQILDIEQFTDGAGVKRCNIVLSPELVMTQMQPKRPFQGWRYLKASEAPRDIASHSGNEDMPEDMRRELMELCLI